MRTTMPTSGNDLLSRALLAVSCVAAATAFHTDALAPPAASLAGQRLRAPSHMTAFVTRAPMQMMTRRPARDARRPVNMLTGRDLHVNWATPDAAGGFGCVYFGKDRDGTEVVVKVAFKDDFAEKLLSNELHFNRKLHGAVPDFHGRRWASFLGSCRIPDIPGFPEEVSRKQVRLPCPGSSPAKPTSTRGARCLVQEGLARQYLLPVLRFHPLISPTHFTRPAPSCKNCD